MGKPKAHSTTPKRDEASNLVLSYLRKQNRPYSATDITNNLHNQVTKSTAQKVLQELVDAGGVSCKTQGKQSVYVIRQDDEEMPKDSDLADMDATIESLKLQIADSKDQIKQLTTRQTALASTVPTAELEFRISHIDNEIAELEKGIEVSRKTIFPLHSYEQREQFEIEILDARKIYLTRRSIFQEMVDVYVEGKGKEAYEEVAERLGIEEDTDEFLEAMKRDEERKVKMGLKKG